MLPTTYAELFKQGSKWEKLIQQQVRLERVRDSSQSSMSDLSDAMQEVCLRLMQSKILERFVRNRQRQIEDVMTAREACAFLGMTFKEWEKLQWAFIQTGADAPTPVRGARLSRSSVYRVIDLVPSVKGERYDEEVHFSRYLTRAVGNHFKNHKRTLRRKFKDLAGAVEVSDTLSEAGTSDRSEAVPAKQALARIIRSAGVEDNLSNMNRLARSLEEGWDLFESLEDLRGTNFTARQRQTVRATVAQMRQAWVP